jgi:aspartate/tyrosine/aromatic aminotransferase
MLDQAIRNEVDSPEALAYAVRNGVLSEKELRSIELHDAVSITMQNRIDDLLKSVVQQLLQDPLGGGG